MDPHAPLLRLLHLELLQGASPLALIQLHQPPWAEIPPVTLLHRHLTPTKTTHHVMNADVMNLALTYLNRVDASRASIITADDPKNRDIYSSL